MISEESWGVCGDRVFRIYTRQRWCLPRAVCQFDKSIAVHVWVLYHIVIFGFSFDYTICVHLFIVSLSASSLIANKHKMKRPAEPVPGNLQELPLSNTVEISPPAHLSANLGTSWHVIELVFSASTSGFVTSS